MSDTFGDVLVIEECLETNRGSARHASAARRSKRQRRQGQVKVEHRLCASCGLGWRTLLNNHVNVDGCTKRFKDGGGATWLIRHRR
jgi:hypothetical protein